MARPGEERFPAAPGFEPPAERPGTPDDAPDLRFYLDVLWGRKWLILFCFVLAFFIGAFDLRNTRPQYVATAVMKYEPETARVFEFSDGTAVPAGTEELRTQIELIASPSVAERVIDALPAEPARADTGDPGNTRSGALVEQLQEAIGKARLFFRTEALGLDVAEIDPEILQRQLRISSLLSGLDVSQRPKTYLIEVAYYSADPRRAAIIANEFCRQFIDFVGEVRYRASEDARGSAKGNIEDIRTKLGDAESKLLEYQVADVRLLEMKKKITEGQIQELYNAIDEAESELIKLEADAHGLEMAQERGVILSENAELRDVRKRINELMIKRANLVAEAQPNHPDLIKTEREITILDDNLTSAVLALRVESDVRMSVVRQTLDVQKRRLENLEVELDFLGKSLIEHNALSRDAETYRQLYAEMLTKYKEMTVASTMQNSPLSIVATADIPRFPESPKVTRVMLLYLLLGLFAGVLLALALEHLDRTVKSPSQVESMFGLPTLGLVPFLNGAKLGFLARRKGRQIQLVSTIGSKSPEAEAFRYLRTSIQYSSAGERPKVLVVSSTTPREGKSTATINLAITVAGRGERTLLIDADLKKPVLHQTFRISRIPGLTDVLTGNRKIEECIVPSGIEDSLFLLPAGPSVPSPVDLLDSDAMTKLLEGLRSEYSTILIDSPPLTGMADAYVLARRSDGLCLVVRAGMTRRDLLSKAVSALDHVGARILGAIYNASNRDRKHSKYYGYGYYAYGYDQPDETGSEATTPAKPASHGTAG
ncbi:polysaccharide biosynthesis tyrosine autokinase [Candidatus Poribacteria bacterium]|nr:polysaccharide biosynthesis tyrosine autokinase [Candidatus Poribacteria bacterium]